MRSPPASVWSIRPKSSPPPAKSPATPSITAAAGTLLIEILREGSRRGVRLTFTDQGPGIPDLGRAMTDGYTTGSGLGLGLSGAKRLSNEFDIVSSPGRGTVGYLGTMEIKCLFR